MYRYRGGRIASPKAAAPLPVHLSSIMKYLRSILLCTLALLAVASAGGAVYNVGPAAGQIPSLSGVPWGTLQPGDIVNINVKPGGYHEIIQISAAGTAAAPILI